MEIIKVLITIKKKLKIFVKINITKQKIMPNYFNTFQQKIDYNKQTQFFYF